MIYQATEAGVNALKKLMSRLQEQVQAIQQATSALQSELDSNKSGLGPHAGSIQSVIDEMGMGTQEASSPVNELAEKVDALAASYQEFIGNDRF